MKGEADRRHQTPGLGLDPLKPSLAAMTNISLKLKTQIFSKTLC
jgi:hypothetical protein